MLDRIKEERDYGILADVLCYILFSIIGSRLLLIDVLLKDIAKRVRIKLVASTWEASIKMPLVGIEDGKNSLKGLIGYLNARVIMFQFMHIEEAAIEIRYFTE